MTAAAVRGTGSMAQQVYSAGSTSQTQSTDATGFQELWAKQTQTQETARDAGDTGTTSRATKQEAADKTQTDTGQDRQGTRVEDRTNTQETRVQDGAEDKAEQSADESWTDEERLEAMEVVASAAQTLVSQIAETLQISEDDVRNLMESMGLEQSDLLNPQNLSDLILQASGADGTVDLLTNESLYTDYQTLMDQGKELLEQSADELGVSAQELVNAMTQAESTEPVTEMPQAESTDDGLTQPEITVQTTDTLTGASAAEQSAQAQTESGSDEAGAQADEEPETNPFLNQSTTAQRFDQTIQAENAESAADVQSAYDVDTQDMMRQIMDYMKVQVKPGFSHLEMQLHPENLGTLQVQVQSRGGVVTANFVTENEAVKAALESQMVQLQQSFEEQGVRVDAVEVSVQAHLFRQDLDQSDGEQSGETGEHRPRTRRLRLDLDNLENLDELTEEEQLAAKVMDMNGGTVDYTA